MFQVCKAQMFHPRYRALICAFVVVLSCALGVALAGCGQTPEAEISQKIEESIRVFQNSQTAQEEQLISSEQNPFQGFGVDEHEAATSLLKHFSYTISDIALAADAQTAEVHLSSTNADMHAIMEAATQTTLNNALETNTTTEHAQEITARLGKEILQRAASDDAPLTSAETTLQMKKEGTTWVFSNPSELLTVLFAGQQALF